MNTHGRQEKKLRAPWIKLSPELTAFLKVMEAFGETNFRIGAAVLQCKDLKSAAIQCGMTPPAFRQRIHRMQERVRSMVGPDFWIPARQRPSLIYENQFDPEVPNPFETAVAPEPMEA